MGQRTFCHLAQPETNVVNFFGSPVGREGEVAHRVLAKVIPDAKVERWLESARCELETS